MKGFPTCPESSWSVNINKNYLQSTKVAYIQFRASSCINPEERDCSDSCVLCLLTFVKYLVLFLRIYNCWILQLGGIFSTLLIYKN